MKKKLFSEGKIGNLLLKNRIIMSAMQLGYDIERQTKFYESRAKGGAGAIVAVGAINEIAAEKRLIVLEEENINKLNRMAHAVHDNDCKIFFQLFHAGRNGRKGIMKNTEKDPVAPSVVPSPIYRGIPKELTIEEIESTIEDFGKAALICQKASIDGLEISCSAGYLLNQFFSPLTNLRNDKYGGSEENRMRFAKEVIRKVRKYVGPDYPIILRISSSDMLGGYDIDFMKRFCLSLEKGLIDAISVTGGWHESPIPQITANLPEGGFAFLAGAIKRVVNVPVITCNRINNGEIAEEILEKDLGDFVGCARAFLIDPDFANKVESDIPYRKCIACNKGCIERILALKEVCCVFNPISCIYPSFNKKSEEKKRILVIGGGPAGMEASKLFSQMGHDVTIATKEDHLGGLLEVASKPPNKAYIKDNIEIMNYEIKNLGVNIKTKTLVDEKFIENFRADFLIVATGSLPIIPNIKGIHGKNIYTAEEVLKGNQDLINHIKKGKIHIIGGGAVGLETAHYLAETAFVDKKDIEFINSFVSNEMKKSIFSPIDITVVELLSKVGKDLGGNKRIVLNDLKKLDVKIMTDTEVLSIDNNKIELKTKEIKIKEITDTIILAIGYKPSNQNLIDYLEKNEYSYQVIGDALKPRNIMGALIDATELVIDF